MGNSFGNIFRLTSFGESHGAAVGGVIDGMPAGIDVDIEYIQSELDRRRPGQSAITTPRKEADKIEILSGVFEGKTTGTPIGFIIRNENQHSNDYENLRDIYRPSHADYTYQMKYGHRDHCGGGRSSARETINRVVAGAFAKLALKSITQVDIKAYTSQVGEIELERDYKKYDLNLIETNEVRCPDAEKAQEMIQLIKEVKSQGDTIGGVITCRIEGTPIGLGEPVFDRLQSALGHAMLSINAVKGFEYGMGFNGVQYRGSQMNDTFINKDDKIRTKSNNSGGIQGGISNGEDIYFRVAFKPVATLLMEIDTVNRDGQEVKLKARGRHDACVLPRAVPVVEAMAAMVILDYYLLHNSRK